MSPACRSGRFSTTLALAGWPTWSETAGEAAGCSGFRMDFVVKPLQQDIEVGRRVLIGRFRGAIRLEDEGGRVFDLCRPDVRPGSLWPGPATTGLECVIQRDGSLECSWYHPSTYGRETQRATLRGPDARLAAAFRSARPHDGAGRVRITAHGHVTTNRQRLGDAWETVYIGHADPTSWDGWEQWIKEDER